MAIPDLSDRRLFPPYVELPQDGADATPGETFANGTASDASSPWLLAQVKENMTITKPTLILADRDGHTFALVFDGYDRDGLDLAARGLRKGATVLMPGARREAAVPNKDGSAGVTATVSAPGMDAQMTQRRALVRVPAGRADTVQAVAASLEQVLAAAAVLHEQQGQAVHAPCCAACGEAGGLKKLLKCTACGQAWYCNKACQTKGWTDGHKTACKALRGLSRIGGM